VGDRGARGTVELYSPDVGRAFAPMDALRLRGLVFLDAGTVRIDPVPAQAAREDIASAGLGLRLAYARSFSLRLDVGYVLAGGGVRERGDTRGHLSLALVY
ncbi:MAG: ShlB/FhaC/HecB family hemolysin secretion/activation protein, partial [Myxococcota bacterium]|nr:ShlB/FhaC/HecB family hemolysin secretion/activation protein [Myxococcota bacterium]